MWTAGGSHWDMLGDGGQAEADQPRHHQITEKANPRVSSLTYPHKTNGYVNLPTPEEPETSHSVTTINTLSYER